MNTVTCTAANTCQCNGETAAAFCQRSGKNCDTYSGYDQCGNAKSAYCGYCSYPATCGAVTANVCGCTGQTDAALCAAGNKQCGSWMSEYVCSISIAAPSCSAVSATAAMV